jgi:hypothetical protein
MTRFEKIFFFSIITIEFILLLILNSQLNKCRQNQDFEQVLISENQRAVLSSFFGESITGEKELIHFTSYSTNFFIFVSYSNNCGGCDLFLKKMQNYFLKKVIDKDIRLILVTSDDSKSAGLTGNFEHLKVLHEDSIQFGLETPSIFAVNGKGEILFKQIGYSDGVFDTALETINKSKYKKSRSINE